MGDRFELFAFASNHDGSKIFCRLACNKKTMAKGYYDFDKEKFFVTNYVKKNFKRGIGKKTINKNLKEILNIDYDWEM